MQSLRPVSPRIFVLVLAVATLALLPGASTADSGSSGSSKDKIRLLEAISAPDPFLAGGPPATLSTIVAVRPIDGLADQIWPDCDHDEPDDDDDEEEPPPQRKWFVELTWAFDEPGKKDDFEVTSLQELTAPFEVIQLLKKPDKPSAGTRAFIRVQPTVSFNGLTPKGVLLAVGSHAFTVQARLIRRTYRSHGSPKERTVDRSSLLSGVLHVSARPNPPSVNPTPLLTNVPVLALSGGKPSGTAIVVDGVPRVAAGPGTTWNTTVSLVEGPQSLLITVRDSANRESLPVTVSVTLSTIPPPPPEVTPPPPITTVPTVTISGTKEPGTGIIIDGVVIVPPDDSTSWTAVVTLQEGENTFQVEAVDAAGNKSLVAGGQTADVALVKPVIGDLTATPDLVPTGYPVQIGYRLFAEVPPPENGPLRVTVRVEDGDLLVRTVFDGTQTGSPQGAPFSVTWDGRDASGQPVTVNTAYRIVVSASRLAPSTAGAEITDANPKETAVVVTGSRHAKSDDGSLEVISRPDDLIVTFERQPVLSAEAGRRLQVRGLHPAAGCWRIRADRPFQGVAAVVARLGRTDGQLVLPFGWDEVSRDWIPLGRPQFNSTTKCLMFVLSRPMLFVLATTRDVDRPRLATSTWMQDHWHAQARDDGTGLRQDRIKVRQAGQDLSGQVHIVPSSSPLELALDLEGVSPTAGPLEVYLEDAVGNGTLSIVTPGGVR